MDQQPRPFRRVNSDPIQTKPLPAPTIYNPLGLALGVAGAGAWTLYFISWFGGLFGWFSVVLLLIGWALILLALVILGAGLSNWLSRRKAHG